MMIPEYISKDENIFEKKHYNIYLKIYLEIVIQQRSCNQRGIDALQIPGYVHVTREEQMHFRFMVMFM